MNYTTAVMLVNQNIRAVKTIYEPDTERQKQTRYIFKTLDTSIMKGDLVVVPTDTRHGYTVVLVDETDVEIDFDSDVQIKWIIDKVDVQAHASILSKEDEWIAALKMAQNRKKREELKKSMLDFYTDADNLPIAHMGEQPTLEHKPGTDTVEER